MKIVDNIKLESIHQKDSDLLSPVLFSSSNLSELIRIVSTSDSIRYFPNLPLQASGVDNAKCSVPQLLSATESATIATHSQVDYNNRLSVRTVY